MGSDPDVTVPRVPFLWFQMRAPKTCFYKHPPYLFWSEVGRVGVFSFIISFFVGGKGILRIFVYFIIVSWTSTTGI